MATKNTTTKKTPLKKKPAVKSTKTTVKKATKPARKGSVRALKLQREQEDFMTFRVNRETVYWMVLGAVVILFAMWILQLQSDIQKLYDQIDASAAAYDSMDMVETKKKN